MKMRKYLLSCLLPFAVLCAGELPLLPTPKTLEMHGTFVLKNAEFSLRSDWGKQLSPTQIKLFADTLSSRLGWKQKQTAKFEIQLKKSTVPHKSKEYYTLDISPEKVSITAAAPDGIFRGMARLQALSVTQHIRRENGRLVLPRLSIKDHPDNKERIFQINLRQVYAQTPEKLMLEMTFMLIDRAAEMQFNHVMLMIGGSMKLDGHPEINPHGPVWTKDKIRLMVERVHARGMKCGPLINSIGHAAAGPYICPIYDKAGKKVIGINVTDPKFDKLFFRYIDELADLFPGAEYFGIGTDEFHRVMKEIEKLSGKKCEEYYPEYVNKVSRHLKKRGLRTMIYHDMLGPGGRYKWPVETLNGPKGAMDMLKKFDKDVIVAYWNYFHAYDYPFVKDLQNAGLDIWFTGWYGEHCLGALYRLGNKFKAPLFTTYWSAIPAKNEFVHGSEFSWNVNSPLTQNQFNDLNNFLFYGRQQGFIRPAAFEHVRLTGGIPLFAAQKKLLEKRFNGTKADSCGLPLDFSSARSFGKIKQLKQFSLNDVEQLNKQGKLKNCVIYTPNTFVQRAFGSKVGVNEERNKQKTIFYTSSFGKSTRTNNRGVEFSVDKNGIIKELSGNCFGKSGDEKGNMTIPDGGTVVSWHEAQPCFFYRSNTFYQTLKKGDKLYLAQRSSRALTRQIISGKFRTPRRQAVLWLTAAAPLEPARLLKVTFELTNGKKLDMVINGSDFITAPNILLQKPVFETYLPFAVSGYKLFPILAVEYRHTDKNVKISGVSVQATTAALEAGASVLGATAFDEKEEF